MEHRRNPDPRGLSAPRAEIRLRAVKLLADREHSRLELGRKLRARAYAAEDVEQVLDALESEGLQSEERFVDVYVGERLRKGFGPSRIRLELRERGVDDACIGERLDLDDSRCLALMEVADVKRFGVESRKDPKTLAKRARFLEYRGFPTHLVARFLDVGS